MTDIVTAINALPRQHLTPEQCADLIRLARTGDAAAKQTLLREYMGPIVREVGRVTKFANSIGQGTDDTMSEAFSEAVRIFYGVVNTFDLDRGMHGFVNYLSRTLRNDEELQVRRGIARVPQRTLYRRTEIVKAADGDLAKARELAPGMGMPLATFDAVTATLGATEEVGGLGNGAKSDMGEGPGAPNYVPPQLRTEESGYVRTEDLLDTARALDALEYIPRLIVESTYGLNGQPEQSAAEIGKMLGMSRWAVQRRLDAAMVDMKQALTNTNNDQESS